MDLSKSKLITVAFLCLATLLIGLHFGRTQNFQEGSTRVSSDKRDFIITYCEKLESMSETILENVKNGTLSENEQRVSAVMLSTIVNIHDELIEEVWSDYAQEHQLSRSEADVRLSFINELDQRMQSLIDFEDNINDGNYEQILVSLPQNREMIRQLQAWVRQHMESGDVGVKMVANEAFLLLESKKEFLLIIENALNSESGGVSSRIARPIMDKCKDRTIRYIASLDSIRI